MNGLLETVRLAIDGNGGQDVLTLPCRTGWTASGCARQRRLDEHQQSKRSTLRTGDAPFYRCGIRHARRQGHQYRLRSRVGAGIPECCGTGGIHARRRAVLRSGPHSGRTSHRRVAAGAEGGRSGSLRRQSFVYGTPARLEIDMHDHDGDIAGPFNDRPGLRCRRQHRLSVRGGIRRHGAGSRPADRRARDARRHDGNFGQRRILRPGDYGNQSLQPQYQRRPRRPAARCCPCRT